MPDLSSPPKPTGHDRTPRAWARSIGVVVLAGLGVLGQRAAGQVDAAWQAGDAVQLADDKAEPKQAHKLYTQTGKDPAFKKLVDDGVFPVGKQSDTGVKGSTIDVNNKRVERGPTADNPIPDDILIHTLCNSHIKRKEFDKWTRWYQEDGNTQVFRLFEGEHNVRNKRPDAGRVEAYSDLKWKRGEEWHRWDGTYTIIKPHGCMIFQVKNTDNEWAVSILMNDEGDIKINHRRNQEDVTIAKGVVGRPFLLTVRDNGHDYEVYYNRKKVGEGSYDRPKGETRFRWGMYGKTFRHDAMLFVTGATFE